MRTSSVADERILRHRTVHLDGCVFARAEFADVAHHAHDLHEVLAIEGDALADGVFILPGAPRQRAVHQDDHRRLFRVGIAEGAARRSTGMPTVRK